MSRSLSDWLELLEQRHPTTIDLGLDRVSEVWQNLGSPRPAERVFTVAGTNGKGSTVAYLSHMLAALGYSQGCYTTPHLIRYNERITIDGQAAPDAAIVDAFERIEQARGDISLTYFEFGTLAAILLMSDRELDFAVLEVGLGGRLDAVNIIDTDCAVITPVGLDHQEYLGPDRESIGREKAGIVRRGAPLVCGEADPPSSVLETADSLAAPVARLGREFAARQSGRVVEFHWQDRVLELPLPAMRGRHQVDNMAAAVAALLTLLPAAEERLDRILAGLRSVRLPGRMQQLSRSPLVLVDVGHNPLAAVALEAAIRDAAQVRPGGQCRCVIAMLKDKDAGEVVSVLRPVVSEWYCAGLEGERGQSGMELSRKILSAAESARIQVCPDVADAFETALQESAGNDCVLVFGSFLTAAAAIEYWSRTKTPD